MMSHSLQIHTYYLDLIELSVALLFVIVLKIVMLLAMQKLSGVLSDDDDRRAAGISLDSNKSEEAQPTATRGTGNKRGKKRVPKPHLSAELNQVRWLLTFVLVIAAVWQVRPYMLFVSAKHLIDVGSLPGAAHWWVAHSLWLNIWTIIIELTFAALFASFGSPLAIRIFAIMFLLYSLIVWVFLQGFGSIFSTEPTFLGEVPGTGLLLAIAVLPLVLQRGGWKRMMPWVLSLYWLFLCIVQWLPANQFWSGLGYQHLASLESAALPSSLRGFTAASLDAMSHAGIIITAMIGLIGLALAALHVWFRKTVTFVVSFIVLLLLWVFVQGFGFGGNSFSCGTALVACLLEWMAFKSLSPNFRLKEKHATQIDAPV